MGYGYLTADGGSMLNEEQLLDAIACTLNLPNSLNRSCTSYLLARAFYFYFAFDRENLSGRQGQQINLFVLAYC